MSGGNPDLCVAICTWNRSARLAATLAALRRCRIPPGLRWEILVVDNNSTDDTRRTVQSIVDLPVIYLFEPEQGLARARNRAIRECRAPFLVFTDDDVEPSAEWVATYWDAYRRFGDRYYYGGPIRSLFEGPPPGGGILEIAPVSVAGLDLGSTERELERGEEFVAANWACAIDPLREVGGFDPELGLNADAQRVFTGEETDLMRRLRMTGRSGYYLPDAVLGHHVPRSKCTLAHVGDRIEASAYYFASNGRSAPSAPRLVGIPLPLSLRVWSRWYAYRRAVRKGGGIAEYAEYRSMRGRVRAVRDRRKSGVRAPHGSARKTTE